MKNSSHKPHCNYFLQDKFEGIASRTNGASTSLLDGLRPLDKSFPVVLATAARVRPVWLLSPAESRCEAVWAIGINGFKSAEVLPSYWLIMLLNLSMWSLCSPASNLPHKFKHQSNWDRVSPPDAKAHLSHPADLRGNTINYQRVMSSG